MKRKQDTTLDLKNWSLCIIYLICLTFPGRAAFFLMLVFQRILGNSQRQDGVKHLYCIFLFCFNPHREHAYREEGGQREIFIFIAGIHSVTFSLVFIVLALFRGMKDNYSSFLAWFCFFCLVSPLSSSKKWASVTNRKPNSTEGSQHEMSYK